MTAPDDIRSTEKLLQLIRSPKQPQTPSEPSSGSVQSAAPKSFSLMSALRIQKKAVVGVDIGHTYVRLAKAARLGDKRYELLDYLHIPLETQSHLQDPDFQARLQEGLDRICGTGAPCDIWAAIPSAKVEVRYLRVPKLKRKQMANAVFWTFTNKVAFNEKEEILDYEILGDITEGGVRKTEVMAFKAPKGEVGALQSVFQQLGYPLKGITIVPFAVQNLLRTQIVAHEEKDVCCLFVGRDWSRIAIYSQGNLVLSRGIKAGMRSMVEAINLAMSDQGDWTAGSGAEAEPDQDIEEDEDTAVIAAIHPAAQRLFFDFIAATPLPTTPLGENGAMDPDKVFQMILPAMERLVRQVERTFEHYALHFHRDGVKRLYLSGQITANAMLVGHISRQLDMPTEVMNPFAPGTPFVQNVTIPDTRQERESYLPAIGLAVSHNSVTPNLIHTHKDKEAEEGLRRFNQRILIGCMACLLALLFIFSWQERRLDAKRDHIAGLNHQLMSYTPPAEREILLALFSQTQKKQQALSRLAQRYAPVAVINELAQITPANIRLIGVTLDGPKTPGQRSASATQTLTIDGIVFGDPGGSETTLTSYLLALRNSPVFSRPTVQNRQAEYYNTQEVLRFQARLEIP